MIERIKALYKKYEEIVNYLIIGGLTTIIALATKYFLLFTFFDAKNAWELQASVIISWIVAVVFAYVTNRIFVFKSKEKNLTKEMSKFFSARIATLIMESFLMWFFVTLLKMDSNTEVIIISLIVQVLIIIGNYVLSKLFVFKTKTH